MNPITDERLMAYADDEVDAVERESIEQALRSDPLLAARAHEMKQLRARLQAGLQGELDEPVPERLDALLRGPAAAPVVELAAVRERRGGEPRVSSHRWPAWWQLGGMAASLLAGVLLARGWVAGDAAPFAEQAGRVLVRGALEQALSTRLAGDGPKAGVVVQLSFVDRAGSYCRTFSIDRAAGLACRDGDAWVLQNLLATEVPPAGALRQAASSLPPALLEAVDRRIAGYALDATAERAARDGGWRR
jgi:hypothetical protein